MLRLRALRRSTADYLTQASLHNAMVVHAAFGGSTNLLLHLPAIAYPAGLKRPTVEDWDAHQPQRAAAGGCAAQRSGNYATVQVFLAGGVPEVMLHLRRAGLLDVNVTTVAGETLDACLDWWEASERRLCSESGSCHGRRRSPTTSSWIPDRAQARGLTSTVCFPVGNLAPEGSVIKSTAIDPAIVDADGVYRKTGPARVFIIGTCRHRRDQAGETSSQATLSC